jgi:hypothetical protein
MISLQLQEKKIQKKPQKLCNRKRKKLVSLKEILLLKSLKSFVRILNFGNHIKVGLTELMLLFIICIVKIQQMLNKWQKLGASKHHNGNIFILRQYNFLRLMEYLNKSLMML